MGNVKGINLHSIWNGPKAQLLREIILEKNQATAQRLRLFQALHKLLTVKLR